MSAPYVSHAFHDKDRDWPETNCYVDVLIELLHDRGLDVAAMMGFTLPIDFEGDQFTFFKPSPGDLFRLYGVEIEELTIWRDLERHLVFQLEQGRIPLIEVNGFFLPDTAGQSYEISHAKTTIAIDKIDPAAQTMRYFHSRGRWVLGGAEYRSILRLDPVPPPEDLMPYCEIAKFDHVAARTPEDLRRVALELLRGHLARRPTENPILRYAASVEQDLMEIAESDPEDYDLYAFAAIRQCGAGFRFASDHLAWLAPEDPRLGVAVEAFATISGLASMLVLKMARIAHSGRMRDLSDTFQDMARAWERGMTAIDQAMDDALASPIDPNATSEDHEAPNVPGR